MADMRNRTPFYGAVPTSKLQSDHVFMADGSTLESAFTSLSTTVHTLDTYSTDEQRVGTWIDGKPLYRKTLTLTTTTGANNIPVADISSDLDYIAFVGGSIIQASGNISGFPYNLALGDSAGWYYRAATSEFVIQCGGSYGFGDTSVTIYYTKSTDTANRSLLSNIRKIAKKLTDNARKLAAEAEEQEG